VTPPAPHFPWTHRLSEREGKARRAPRAQVCEAMEDGVPFGDHDAQLKLDQGTPRFYIMRECPSRDGCMVTCGGPFAIDTRPHDGGTRIFCRYSCRTLLYAPEYVAQWGRKGGRAPLRPGKPGNPPIPKSLNAAPPPTRAVFPTSLPPIAQKCTPISPLAATRDPCPPARPSPEDSPRTTPRVRALGGGGGPRPPGIADPGGGTSSPRPRLPQGSATRTLPSTRSRSTASAPSAWAP